MYPYQHSPSSGTSSSGPGPSTSQQFLGNMESAASRLKRAFGKKRSTRLGDDEGTQSEAPSPRKLLPGPRLSSLLPRKDPKPALQFASTFQSIGQRLNKSSSPRVVSYIEESKEPTSSKHSTAPQDVKASPSSPLKVPSTPKRGSHLVPTSEISAAIDYMMDSTSGTNSPSSPPKTAVHAEQVTPRPARVSRSGSFEAENASASKSTKRRSMSLSMIPVFAQSNEIQHVQATSTPPSSFSLSSKLSPSIYQPHHRSHSAIPTFPDTGSTSSLSAATPISSNYNSPDMPKDKPSSSNLKDRLTAWAAPSNPPRATRGSSPGHSKTMSMVASLAPAANAATGLAVSFSKRAYEKVNSILTPTSSYPLQESNLHSAQPSEVSDSSLRGRKLHAHSPTYGGSHSDAEGSRRRMNFSAVEQPPAPNLGPLLRPPFRSSGGLLFGRPLVDCVRDTKALVVLGSEVNAGLESRLIPALVLRCVQHIERWGVAEEGLFRIAGRTSHVNKIRFEFANGADYDLQSCGPGDLDPHAVSSVLKAFIRELPEPILTRETSPLFDAAFERAKESGFMLVGMTSARMANPQMMGHPGFRRGLPSNPRPVQTELPQLSSNERDHEQDKTREDGASTSRVSPEEALQTLVTEFRHLTSSLAKENQDLLLTITELLDKVSSHSNLTKMPLSNLLLVLCPSMNMNPGVLKVLVEHHRIIFSDNDDSPTNSSSGLGTIDQQTDQDVQSNDLQDASSSQDALREEELKEVTPSLPLGAIMNPIPANKLPVRKQSLRKHALNLSQARTTPSSSPSALKDTFQAQTSDVPTSEADASHRTPSTQTNSSYGEMTRPPQPVGPRLPKVAPAPIKVRPHSSSLSRDSQISSNGVLESLPQPPATAPPNQNHYPPQNTSSNRPTFELSVSQSSSLQVEVLDSPAPIASRHTVATEQEASKATLLPNPLPAPNSEDSVTSSLETRLPTEPVPLFVETSASRMEKSAPQPDTGELHPVNVDSAVSSANTELNLLDQLGTWPEVPRTELAVTPATTKSAPGHSTVGSASSALSSDNTAQHTDHSIHATAIVEQPIIGGEQKLVPLKTAAETLTSDNLGPSVATDQNTLQHQPSTIPPNRNGVLNGGEENIPDATASTKSSAATGRDAAQVVETKNMRPLQSHAPRLTVNSKEMLSGDSYWAKELQRAIQSTTPASPIDGRHSGEWANSVLNTAGL